MVCWHISVEVKELALSLSLQGLSDSEIHEYTGISKQTIQRVRSLHRRTGNVAAPPPLNIGRPRTLASTQILVRLQYLCPVHCLTDTAQYLRDCIERQADMSLVELQNELHEVFDIDVSLPTILRSLQREGYTMKTVRFYHLNQSVGLITTMLGVAFCS